MRVRLIGMVLGLLIVPIVARANDHRADAAMSASVTDGGSLLFGARLTLGKTFLLPATAAEEPRFPCLPGLVGEISAEFGTHDNTDESNTFLLAAGRCSFAKSRSLIHALGYLGMSNTPDGNLSDGPKDFAFGAGVAWDIAFADRQEVSMTEYSGWGLRLQLDMIQRKGIRDAVTRFSAGFVYRFPRP